MQMNLLTSAGSGLQDPPFLQGFTRQTSFLSQFVPMKSSLQTHLKDPGVFSHFWVFATVQGPMLELAAHSSLSCVQVVPVHPLAQVQVKELTPSWQVPPFLQLVAVQSLMFVSQEGPVKPIAHVQTCLVASVGFTLQVAPFLHGFGTQTSVLSQRVPTNPALQTHL